MVVIASYGAIHKYTLRTGERRSIDNGHLLAWSASMKYRTKRAASSVWCSITSGEGLMCDFVGPDTAYLQSHKPGNQAGGDGVEGVTAATGRSACTISCFGVVFVILLIFLALWTQMVSLIKVNDTPYDAGNNYHYRPNKNNYKPKTNYDRYAPREL